MSVTDLALIIILLIAVQIVIAVWVSMRRRAGQNSKQTQVSEVSPSARSPKSNDSVMEGWQGYREFIVVHREMEDENGAICSFYLKPTDSGPLMQFKPGQYLTFKLDIPAEGEEQTQSVIRCYSLSDQPGKDYYRVTIKRVLPPADQPDAPPGRSSNYFHDHVFEGTRLQVKAPSGHFYLKGGDGPVVLIAGGVGITPMLSMINAMLTAGDQRQIWLFYGVRNDRELVMKRQLLELSKRHSNFHLLFCFSEQDVSGEEDVGFYHRGRVDISLLQQTLKFARYQFYVCGPRPMMESLIPELEDLGVSSDDVFYESFGPASLTRHQPSSATLAEKPSKPALVTLSRSDLILEWDSQFDSLLAFVEAKGIAADSGCRAGSCGTCQTTLLSGEVEYNQQPDADIAAGRCLLCIAKPKSDLTLDL